MKYVDEFRDCAVAAALAEQIRKTVRRPWTIMEVCGGQAHAIVRFGVNDLLPKAPRYFLCERLHAFQSASPIGDTISSSKTRASANLPGAVRFPAKGIISASGLPRLVTTTCSRVSATSPNTFNA